MIDINSSIVKKLILLICLTVTVLPNSFSQNTSSEKNWQLVWSDEFEDNDIDWKVWTKVPRRTPNWCRHMSDYDSLYDIKN